MFIIRIQSSQFCKSGLEKTGDAQWFQMPVSLEITNYVDILNNFYDFYYSIPYFQL